MARGEDGNIVSKAEKEDPGAVRQCVANFRVGSGNVLEPGFQPDDELGRGEAFTLADTSLDLGRFGESEGGDNFG